MLMRPQVVRAVRKLCAVGRHSPALEVFDKQLTLVDILGGRGREVVGGGVDDALQVAV